MDFEDNIPGESTGWNGENKTKFRARKVWKDFRAVEIKHRRARCELCNGDYSKHTAKLELHHQDPENYDRLDRMAFRLLCPTDHEYVEYWDKKIRSPKFVPGPHFKKVFLSLEPFLTWDAIKRAHTLLNSMVWP